VGSRDLGYPLLALELERGKRMATPRTKVAQDSEAAFARIAEELSKDPRVDAPEMARAKGFGSKGLKVARKLFAFHSKGRLVVKLPADRVEALASSGKAKQFDPGHGRLMKEWVGVDYDAQSLWPTLAREALEFAVRHAPERPQRPGGTSKRTKRAPRRQ
jgi:TfoX/Sxy family transcriptional regulator of competence genes